MSSALFQILGSLGLLAFVLLLLLAKLHWHNWQVQRQKKLHNSAQIASCGDADQNHYTVIYASQTGTAQHYAEQTAALLLQTGAQVELLNIVEIDRTRLQQMSTVFFLVSSYGDGDAPDSARGFVKRIMSQSFDLSQIHFAILAFGDRQYDHFCAFGEQLERWLRNQQAQCLFNTIRVDAAQSNDIATWSNALQQCVGHPLDLVLDTADPWWPCVLHSRLQLNIGSQAAPIYQLMIAAPQALHWQAGDCLEIRCGEHLRQYSIASLVESGQLELLVRVHQYPTPHGVQLGIGSHFLTQQIDIGGTFPCRIHRNAALHALASNHPLILVGSGTGMAGILAQLRVREKNGNTDNWIIYGERQAAFDAIYQTQLQIWQQSGFLTRINYAFSRDQPHKVYVQDVLLAQAEQLISWVNSGAHIYVCGSLNGMGQAVDAVLGEILGQTQLEQLMQTGRYLRDVY